MSYWKESPSDEPTTIKGSETGFHYASPPFYPSNSNPTNVAVGIPLKEMTLAKQQEIQQAAANQQMANSAWANMDKKDWVTYNVKYSASQVVPYTYNYGKTYNSPNPFVSTYYGNATQIPNSGVTDGVPNYFLLALSVLKNNLIKSLQAKGNETYRYWVEKTVANEVEIITQQLKENNVSNL